jgi:hypothetical protein
MGDDADMSQLGLFILWEFARSAERRILDDIRSRFTVIGEREVSWEADRFSESLSRFYGQKLPSGARKERHCGRGPFLVVVVEDEAPVVEERPTSRGTERVTTSLFDAKQRYREWTGGGHRVHSTNDQAEFEHDVWFLMGIEAAEVAATRTLPSTVPTLLHGSDGWDSIAEAFRALDLSVEHLVLRNWHDWDALGPTDSHPDVDLMVASVREASLALGAARCSRIPGRVNHRVLIGDRQVDFDLRSPGDGYMPESWAVTMLQERRREGSLWTPDPVAQFWSLLYHACVHKPEVAPDYHDKLTDLGHSIGVTYDRRDPIAQLHDWLHTSDLTPTHPHDPSVHVNLAATPALRGAGTRAALRDGLLRAKHRARPSTPATKQLS